jgi:Tol biopolymer transport system component
LRGYSFEIAQVAALEEDMMKCAKLLLVAMILFVSVACTSTPNRSSSPSSTGGSPTEAPADRSEAGGVIVFSRVDPTGIAVYSLDLGTGTEHKIREVEDFVTLSPDGTRFVDTTLKQDGTRTPATFAIDGSGYSVVRLADPTFEMVVGSGGWSPDGKRFFGGGGDTTDPSRDGLYTVRIADGDGLVRLTGSSHEYAVGYSPDGSHALYISEVKPYGHSGPMDVFVVGTDGSGAVRLNPPGTTSGLEAQSWSPDGRQVAFVAAKGSFWDDDRAVFVADADGTDAHRITPWNETYRAEWSPDGEWIAYDFDPSGYGDPHDLYVVHPDGTGRTQVTSNEDGKMSFAPTWSPDSQTLLFVRRELEDDPDLWTVNVDGTRLNQVTHSPAEYTGYRWLPSPSVSNGNVTFVGDDVVDFSDKLSDFGILFAVDPGGGKPRKILDTDCPFPGETTSCELVGITSVDWSPDGTRVAYALWGPTDAGLGERKGIYVMESETEQVHQLTSCMRPCVFQDDVDWSPDGSRIAYRQADLSGCDWMNSFNGSCSIYTMKPDGTDRVKLSTGSVVDPISPSWSPDGTSVAFSGRVGEDWFVYRMALDGSEPTQLAADLSSPEQTQPAWSPDGSTIAFVTWEGAAEGSKPTGLDKEYGLPCDLWLMAPDGSERRRLNVDCALIGGAGFGVQGPEWSPDSTQILLLAGTGGSFQVIDASTGEVASIPRIKATGPIAWQPVP